MRKSAKPSTTTCRVTLPDDLVVEVRLPARSLARLRLVCRLGCATPAARRRNDMSSMLHIWKLQDYDTGNRSLDYCIGLTLSPSWDVMDMRLTEPWLVVPLRYLDGDDSSGEKKRKLLLATTAQEAHVYDPEASTLRMVASVDQGDNCSDDSLRLVTYQESLFRFPGMTRWRELHHWRWG